MSYHRNQPVIDSLKRELFRERQKLDAATRRIFEIELELATDFGVELPLEETAVQS